MLLAHATCDYDARARLFCMGNTGSALMHAIQPYFYHSLLPGRLHKW